MSYPYYCYPCYTPYYPPCCTLCYVPYIVCCNPCCPSKPCSPSPPKKAQKLVDFSTAGPPDSSKSKNTKKKETTKKKESTKGKGKDASKNVKKGEERTKKPAAKKSVKKEKLKIVKKDREDKGDQEDSVPAKKANLGVQPVTTVKRGNGGNGGDGGKKRPTTTGDVTTKKDAKGETVVQKPRQEDTGAGDSAPARRAICKCFARQQNAHVCTPKPCTCIPKSQGAPMFRQFVPSNFFPRAVNPKLQYPQTAPSFQNKTKQPCTTRICTPKGYAGFPFAGDGLCTCKIDPKRVPRPHGVPMSPTVQNKERIFGPAMWNKAQQPEAQIFSGKAYKPQFAGDGLHTGTTCKCVHRQPNTPMPPSQNKRWPPGASQYTKPPFGYTQAICGTCGTIKFQPKVPVQPKKAQDCYFKGSFAIR